MRYLGDVCDTRDNGFNLLRLIAAVSILIAHCTLVIPVMTLEEATANPNIRLGVDLLLAVFFVFSGFLITGSMERNSSIARFAVARILRIFPGLFVVSILLALLLGPFVTNMNLGEYFAASQTWEFAPIMSLFLDQNAPLPGVFLDHPVAEAVNMPIWTLRYEVVIYAAFPFLYHLFLTRSQNTKAIIFLSFFATVILLKILPIIHPVYAIEKDSFNNLIHFGSSFMIGVALWTYKKSVPYHFGVVLLFWLLFSVSAHLEIRMLFGVLAAGYSFIWVAFASVPTMRAYNVMGDYSYGVYIIHFPVAQAIYGMDNGISPALLTIQTFAITLSLAIILWNVVEKPSLGKVKAVHAGLAKLVGRAGPQTT